MNLYQFKKTYLDKLPQGAPVLYDARGNTINNFFNRNYASIILLDSAAVIGEEHKLLLQLGYRDWVKFSLSANRDHKRPEVSHNAIYIRDSDISDLTRWAFGKRKVAAKCAELGIDHRVIF